MDVLTVQPTDLADGGRQLLQNIGVPGTDPQFDHFSIASRAAVTVTYTAQKESSVVLPESYTDHEVQLLGSRLRAVVLVPSTQGGKISLSARYSDIDATVQHRQQEWTIPVSAQYLWLPLDLPLTDSVMMIDRPVIKSDVPFYLVYTEQRTN